MQPNDVAPVLVFGFLSFVGIIAILVRHQQRMAMILHGKADPVKLQEEQTKALALTLYGPKGAARMSQPGLESRLDSLEKQVGELKDLVHQQTLMLDSLAHPAQDVQEVRRRLEQ